MSKQTKVKRVNLKHVLVAYKIGGISLYEAEEIINALFKIELPTTKRK